jgi:ADP-ribose pyrophosphatase YjhB (NUDIX family)
MAMDDAAVRGPTLLDRAYQLGYTVAYRLVREYWRVRRPVTHGALVALWNRGKVLLIRNSYVPYYSSPGGYVQRGEDAINAAARELREEVGISVPSERLALALEVTHEWEHKHDHVQIFELALRARPITQVYLRVFIAAAWFTPEQAATLQVFPPLAQVIAKRRA